MKKTKNIPQRNYVILISIYVVVIILVLYLASWYSTYQKYQNEIPVLQDVVSEIKPNEVDHYLMENPSTILYICSVSDKNCREFEESMKSPLQKNNYQDITYINLEGIDDKKSFIRELLDKYNGTDFTISRVPCLIKFTDGKITNVTDGLNGKILTRDEALNFIDSNITESEF